MAKGTYDMVKRSPLPKTTNLPSSVVVDLPEVEIQRFEKPNKEILFKKGPHLFHLLKTCSPVRITHFNVLVAVSTAKIRKIQAKSLQHSLEVFYDML